MHSRTDESYLFFSWVSAMLWCSKHSFITKYFMKTNDWYNRWPKGAQERMKTEMPLSWRMYSYIYNWNVKWKCKHCGWKYSKNHRKLHSDEHCGIHSNHLKPFVFLNCTQCEAFQAERDRSERQRHFQPVCVSFSRNSCYMVRRQLEDAQHLLCFF